MIVTKRTYVCEELEKKMIGYKERKENQVKTVKGKYEKT